MTAHDVRTLRPTDASRFSSLVRYWLTGWRPVAFVLFSLAVFVTTRYVFGGPGMHDLFVYRAEGRALLHGDSLYGPLPGTPSLATYPPFAAALFVPLSWFPYGLVAVASVVGNFALCVWCVYLALRISGRTPVDARPLALLVGGIAAWSEPVLTTVGYGQVNLVLLALVLWDFRPGRSPRTAGIALGLAAGIKLTPAIFIVYLLLTGRRRQGLVAVATGIGTVVLSLLISAHETWSFWTRYVFDLERVGRLENAVNQTLRGVAVRAEHLRDVGPWVTVVVAVVAVAGLVVAMRAYRTLGEVWGVSVCAATALLCAPIAWSHHWVWCLVFVVVLLPHRAMLTVAVAVFGSSAVWWLDGRSGHELHLSLAQFAISAWYVLFGLGYIAFAAYRTHRAHQPHRTRGID